MSKAARREAQNRQRELDRKYYKPDTERYKKLKRLWWICLGGAIACTALSWFTSTMSAGWLPMVFLFAAYALIIFAFYIDFSKIRKERTAYQQRMAALEDKQEKKQRRRNAHNSNASKDDKSKEESSEDANAAKTEEKDVKKKRGIAGLFSGSKKSKAEPSEKKA